MSAAVSLRPYQRDFLKSRQNFLETLLTLMRTSESLSLEEVGDRRSEVGEEEDIREEVGYQRSEVGEEMGEEVGDGILETGDGDQETGIRERRGEMALDS